MSEKSITVNIPEITLQQDWDEPDYKLAHLIIESVIFCNNGWWLIEDGKPWQKDAVTLHVNCNDIFAWGWADAEDIKHGEIAELYEMWKKDPHYGAAAWCIKKRKIPPQKPVEDQIRKAGIWNLEELIKV